MNWKHPVQLREKDDGVSPVIGTIMMVAVTVLLAATVVAVMNGFGDKSINEPQNAAFKVQTIDTTNNGATDHIKITYVTGPNAVKLADIVIQIRNTDGTVDQTLTKADPLATWSPGDFIVYNPPAGGTYFITVSVLGNTVVDRSVNVDE